MTIDRNLKAILEPHMETNNIKWRVKVNSIDISCQEMFNAALPHESITSTHIYRRNRVIRATPLCRRLFRSTKKSDNNLPIK